MLTVKVEFESLFPRAEAVDSSSSAEQDKLVRDWLSEADLVLSRSAPPPEPSDALVTPQELERKLLRSSSGGEPASLSDVP